MSEYLRFGSLVFFLTALIASCGTYTPDKDPFTSDAPTADDALTRQGNYEIGIVNHVTCEIGKGLKQAQILNLPWLENWGTTVTQTITVEDQTGLSPGISAVTPLNNIVFPFSSGGNVISAQSFSLNFGGTASANSLRTETIQYTFRNEDILKYFNPTCDKRIRGVMIDGDLKIREFIYDKAIVAASGNASLVGSSQFAWQLPPFNTFTEEITFVASYGGSFTPTWHLARLTANTSANLIVGQRTNTNDLIITLGPLKCPQPQPKRPKHDVPAAPPANAPVSCPPPEKGPVVLVDTAMAQHQARVQANAIAVSVTGQSH